MSDKTWKAAEREVAGRLGTKREGPTGESDAESPVFSVEVKHRRSCPPKYLLDWMEQAEGHAPPGKVPVVVVHRLRQEYDDCLCILRLRDLAALQRRLDK